MLATSVCTGDAKSIGVGAFREAFHVAAGVKTKISSW